MTTATRPVDTTAAITKIVADAITNRRIPVSSYRLQLTPSFGFRDAEAVVPYLQQLGITDVYLSPILRPRTGSSHGYDVADPTQLNPELGTMEDFEALSEAARSRGMGIILDIVPNHMGVGDPANRWWIDLLENGPASAYASYFDVNWRPITPELGDKVLLAVLEDQYGSELERGKFSVSQAEGAFWLHYNVLRFPVAPDTYPLILRLTVDDLERQLGAEQEYVQEYRSILTALEHLPPRSNATPEQVAERSREKEVIKRRLASLMAASEEVRAAVDTAVTQVNGGTDQPDSYLQLDQLIDQQAYRLAFWRVSSEEINYRRFFDVDDLAAIRVELPEVFAAVHGLILQLLAEGKATGLRVDHADGLRDPAAYFWQLQTGYLMARVRAHFAPDEPPEDATAVVDRALRELSHAGTPPRWPLYVVAEKILAEGERLPDQWAVYGTTGYEFLKSVNGLFVDPRRWQAFDRLYHRMVGESDEYHDIENTSKKVVMLISMASEINVLSHNLERLVKRTRHYRDFTLNNLTFALREVIAALPVYRTYLTPAGQAPSTQETRWIQEAVAEAKRRNPRTLGAVFDFLEATLLLRNGQDFPEDDRPALLAWVLRVQQVTGSVMAKGAEDTAFYRYHRLVSLNEVGGNPEHFGTSPAAFHRGNSARQRRWPHNMLATATHDTKRGEDVRARIDALTEYPEAWRTWVLDWARRNRRLKHRVGGRLAPDGNDEYLLYQTLVGAWPLDVPVQRALPEFTDRVIAYMMKALREGKVHTSWISPNEPYEQATQDFARQLLQPDDGNEFLGALASFAGEVARAGALNSLAVLALKLTCPGMPDTYQGTDMWDLSLVDPDNRRPVDFECRQRLLKELNVSDAPEPELVESVLANWQDGRVKLFATARLLAFRRDHERLIAGGSYQPLRLGGANHRRAVGFARRSGREWMLTLVPRLAAGMLPQGPSLWAAPDWGDGGVLLPAGAPHRWRDALTGREVHGRTTRSNEVLLGQALDAFPIAVLHGVGSGRA